VGDVNRFLSLAAPGLRGLAPYVPGKPPETVERELGIRGSIKLASNENPHGPGLHSRAALAAAIARAVSAYRAAGVVSFNMALYVPPLSPDGEDWRRFPPLARLVDRGDPANKTSDIGAMELYAASVIATDPFRVVETLRA